MLWPHCEAGHSNSKRSCLPASLPIICEAGVLLSKGDCYLIIDQGNIINILLNLGHIFTSVLKNLCWRILCWCMYEEYCAVTPSSVRVGLPTRVLCDLHNQRKTKNLVQPEKYYFLKRKFSTVWTENLNNLPNVDTGAKRKLRFYYSNRSIDLFEEFLQHPYCKHIQHYLNSPSKWLRMYKYS